MAVINDYATLQTAVADYLAKSTLETFIPNFIQNFESKLYRTLRIRDMETDFSDTIAAGILSLPTRYLALKYAYVDDSPIGWLERVTPETLYRDYPTRSGGETPCVLTEETGNFIFGPYPTAKTVTGVYYQKYQPLRTSSTNWYTSEAPDVLLYGALLEATPFIQDDERLLVWKTALDEAVETVVNENRVERHSGGTQKARLA